MTILKNLCVGSVLFIHLFFTNAFSQHKEIDSLKINDPAPKFVVRNLNGENIFLRDYCGELRQPWKNKVQHVVILSFFTTYCKPCLKEISVLQKLLQRYQEKELKTFLINLKEDKEHVGKFVAEKKFNLPVLLDKYGVVAKKYDVTSVPRIFVISRKGKLIWKTRGFSENLDEELTKVLNEQFEEVVDIK